jgi:PAS domain S-box-containing protein
VRYPSLGIAYVVLYVATGWALRGDHLALSIFGNAGLLLPAVAVCAIVLGRRHSWRGCQRLFWDTTAVGLALWIVGHVGWASTEMLAGRPTWLQWHTLFSLVGGTLPLVALLALPHRGPRPDAASRVAVDLASYTLLAAFVYTNFVMIPSLTTAGTLARDSLLVLAQLNRFLLLIACVWLAWTSRRRAWGTIYSIIAIGAGIGFFVRIATSAAIARGDYHVGGAYDLAWIVPSLCLAWAAAESSPSANDADAIELPSAGSPALVSAIPVLLIPSVGYGSLQFQPLGSAADSFRVLLTSLLTVAGLGLLTLRLRAQGDELQRADARLKLLAAATEQTGDLILITRVDGRYEHANEAFLRAVGYSREEISAFTFADLIERGFEQLSDRIPAEVREHGVWRGTILRRRRDGTTFPASCTVVALRDGAGEITHFVGVERDMTDELKLRDQLVQSERMSAVGELVAGVAHEINNPLQTIVGCVDLMLDEHRDPALRRDLELMRREAARAGQIIRNLLSFVRRSAPDRASTDLNDIVRATVALREYHLQQNNISLMVHCHDRPLLALVNREEIQQIVVNLLLNAEQAIARGSGSGTITITTSTTNRHHMIEVADDGPGVSPDLRGRIFEPFFTTKQVGEGTGLGLSISHGIASAHGGTLELLPVRSGACFRLILPAQADVPARPHPARAGALGRALVVDDELPIRMLLVRLLERRGFQVIAADSGETALMMSAASAGALTLVISDLRMPGMDGFELYRRLIARDPSLAARYVLMSGDSTAVDEAEDIPVAVPLLRKPFTASDLEALLARLGVQAAADR